MSGYSMKRDDAQVYLVTAAIAVAVLLVFGIAWFAAQARDEARSEVTTWCEYRGGEVAEVCMSNCTGKYPRHEFWCVQRIEERGL